MRIVVVLWQLLPHIVSPLEAQLLISPLTGQVPPSTDFRARSGIRLGGGTHEEESEAWEGKPS